MLDIDLMTCCNQTSSSQIYILAPVLASVVGGLVYEFFFDAHYNPYKKTGDDSSSAKAETAA